MRGEFVVYSTCPALQTESSLQVYLWLATKRLFEDTCLVLPYFWTWEIFICTWWLPFISSMQPRIWIFVQNFVSEISCIYFGTVFPVLQTYCLFKKPGWQANDGYVLVLFWSVNSHVLILHDSLIVSVSYILWKQSIWLVVEILRFLISLESVRRGGLCRWERKLS